jgi:hypothetical protein
MRYLGEIPTLPVAGLNSNIGEIGMTKQKALGNSPLPTGR